MAVAGIGIAGFAAPRRCWSWGAVVIAVDGGEDADRQERAQVLRDPGRRRSGSVTRDDLPAGLDLLVVSPGLPADARRSSPPPQAAGVPVWGELELAWRLRDPDARGATGWWSPAPTARPRPP